MTAKHIIYPKNNDEWKEWSDFSETNGKAILISNTERILYAENCNVDLNQCAVVVVNPAPKHAEKFNTHLVGMLASGTCVWWHKGSSQASNTQQDSIKLEWAKLKGQKFECLKGEIPLVYSFGNREESADSWSRLLYSLMLGINSSDCEDYTAIIEQLDKVAKVASETQKGNSLTQMARQNLDEMHFSTAQNADILMDEFKQLKEQESDIKVIKEKLEELLIILNANKSARCSLIDIEEDEKSSDAIKRHNDVVRAHQAYLDAVDSLNQSLHGSAS